jgi:hypothetical protein
MTECVPSFNFAPQKTWTIGDAVRAANKNYTSFFAGKWHLGSFYNDSEALGGITSSPVTHGFDLFNATVEVAPTATTNCECKEEWYENCDFGHDGGPTHCGGKGNPGGGAPLKPGCCFNYCSLTPPKLRLLPLFGTQWCATLMARNAPTVDLISQGGTTLRVTTASPTSPTRRPTMMLGITWPTVSCGSLRPVMVPHSWPRSASTM